MPDGVSSPQFENVHFPRQIKLIKRLRFVSFIIIDITIGVSLAAILILLVSFTGVKIVTLPHNTLYPFTPVLFLLSCIPLFFGAKSHLLDTHHDASEEKRPWWVFGIPIFFAVITSFLGFINFIGITDRGSLSAIHIAPFTGFCFFLVGLAVIPPYTLIPHRFHLTQFLVFIVSALNVGIILEFLYQLFSPFPQQQVVSVSLLAAFSFILYSLGLLFRWSNRGFFGNFTLDATASIFALRVFIINLISAPLIALIVLLTTHNTSYNMYQVLTFVVVGFAFFSSLLLWLNVKILYGHELEHLMMRETLRFHNIDLTKEEEKLQKKMSELEQEKQQYLEKLKTQDAWQDAAERLE